MENEKSESRICVVNVLVWDRTNSEKVNAVLSQYGDYIIGRMGIPYREKKVSVLCVALDAPVEVVNALTGKLGNVEGVTVKALFGKM
ncbi:MAG: iron-only hydrogenase system regulator [Clostridia bacterium]|nr:iron-only hydrogenase system regulator [Clostridia bacterium]